MDSSKTIHVLLVDDEPNILVPLEFLMSQQGYKVDLAFNGKEALVKMETTIPNIVVLDIMMPEMDGFEVARQIRNNANFDNTHIVFLTAKGTDEDKMTGYSTGGEVYLTKPFDNEHLVQTVKDLIEFG